MTAPLRTATCDGPLLYSADKLSIYYAFEEPSDGQEHSHSDIQIAVPLSGHAYAAWQTASGKQQQRSVAPGSLLLISHRQPHTIQIRERTELAVVWFAPSHFAETGDELTGGSSAVLREADIVPDALLRQLCLHLLAEVRQDQPPARLYLDALTNMMAAHLVRHYSTRSAAVREEMGGLSPRIRRRVLNYIREHLDQDVSLADLAGVAFLSESRFASVFRRSTGQSPYQYVLAQRIEHAKDSLRWGQLSVGEIALQVGFCDQSQFTRQFKKHVGVTPKSFARDFLR